MAIRVIAAFLFLILQVGVSAQQQPRQKASLEGVVIGPTGAPVADARLTLSVFRGAPQLQPPPGVIVAPQPLTGTQTTTGADGKFLFKDVNEGSYSLVIQANSYVAQRLGANGVRPPVTPFILTAGQALKGVTVRLTPAGNISGHVRDRSGQPIASVPIQLLRYTYKATGKRDFELVSKGKTSDRGEYRLYWINPGRYYLSAGTASPAGIDIVAVTEIPSVNEVPIDFGYTYYPGVSDLDSATPVDIHPGDELDAMDIVLSSRSSYSVRGRVVDGNTGKAPANAIISVSSPTQGSGSAAILEGVLPRGRYNPANGVFEIRDVGPGVYTVIATVQDPSAPRNGPTELRVGNFPMVASRGSATVSVTASDVDSAVIITSSPVSVAGRLRSEGQMTDGLTLERFRVSLASTASSSGIQQALQSGGTLNAPVQADGTFRLENITPGEYRVTVQPLIGNSYIKEVLLDGVDVLNHPLLLARQPSNPMEVVVSFNGAQVSGTLTDDRIQPMAGLQVVLIPDRSRDRVDLYKTATTDTNGRFLISGITPGDYRVFGWESIEPFGWFDPETLRQDEGKASPVHLLELSKQTVDVKVIPAGGAR